jgi:ssDNA-binding Zn-finger/Zn-ribbon topoisomerase 1
MSKVAKFFCEECGAEVPPGAPRCPTCGKEFQGVRCPKCGFTAAQDVFAEGCPKCGYGKMLSLEDRPRGEHPRYVEGMPFLRQILFYTSIILAVGVVGVCIALY